MVFNATFNNISVISWQSVLMVEETGIVVIGTDCIGSYKIQLPYDHDLDDSFKILSSINKNLYFLY